jgi:hypothetical protein
MMEVLGESLSLRAGHQFLQFPRLPPARQAGWPPLVEAPYWSLWRSRRSHRPPPSPLTLFPLFLRPLARPPGTGDVSAVPLLRDEDDDSAFGLGQHTKVLSDDGLVLTPTCSTSGGGQLGWRSRSSSYGSHLGSPARAASSVMRWARGVVRPKQQAAGPGGVHGGAAALRAKAAAFATQLRALSTRQRAARLHRRTAAAGAPCRQQQSRSENLGARCRSWIAAQQERWQVVRLRGASAPTLAEAGSKHHRRNSSSGGSAASGCSLCSSDDACVRIVLSSDSCAAAVGGAAGPFGLLDPLVPPEAQPASPLARSSLCLRRRSIAGSGPCRACRPPRLHAVAPGPQPCCPPRYALRRHACTLSP